MNWSLADRKQLNEHDVSIEEVERQLNLFHNPPAPLQIVRACTPNDGVLILDETERAGLRALFEAASDRFSRFIPASGAASRMFKELFDSQAALEQWQSLGQCPDYPFQQRFFSNLARFPFIQTLENYLQNEGQEDLQQLVANRQLKPVIDGLLSAEGLDYARKPKGLLAFHRYPLHVRTPLEEHLSEAVELANANNNPIRLHFTVSPEFVDAFKASAQQACSKYPVETASRFSISFSCQQPSTDTIAADLSGQPLRSEEGQILFRPAGHGALLSNLEMTNADLVLIKNIDNVVPEEQQPEVIRWWQLLGGMLMQAQQQLHQLLLDLESEKDKAVLDRGLLFLEAHQLTKPSAEVQVAPERLRTWLLKRLNRPVRVCGMVRNSGEPGGGPYWVSGPDGITPQIVEMAQIQDDNPHCRDAISTATHFNPVLMACALRDHHGKPYRLADFVDEHAIIMTTKSEKGRELQALERPGLWNGAMAGWLTLFMEVPEQVFQPVKTVNDLLRPGHQVSANH